MKSKFLYSNATSKLNSKLLRWTIAEHQKSFASRSPFSFSYNYKKNVSNIKSSLYKEKSDDVEINSVFVE